MIANSYPQLAWLVAQRIPVRVHIDDVPPGAVLAAGMTAAAEIDDRPAAK
jgi:multidrug resistance efflux pump